MAIHQKNLVVIYICKIFSEKYFIYNQFGKVCTIKKFGKQLENKIKVIKNIKNNAVRESVLY